MVLIGRTGVGKSTLVHQIARSLLASPDRPGLGVIDPHGKLVRDILLHSIPTEREQDVVFLDFADEMFPVGLPLFKAPAGIPTDRVIDSTFSLLRVLFRENWSATRMEDAVFALTATLCALPSATVMDIQPLLTNATFRRGALARVNDPMAREFWRDFETLSPGAQRDLARPILYRIRRLYRSRSVRNLLCQTDGVDFAALVNRGAILLVSLAGEGIQAEADLIGELIIARLHLAALGRLAQPETEERRRFYLTIDESQRFGGASLPVLLREGRKGSVALILCTQYLAAWGEDLAASVLGNVGALVAFRCGPADSRQLRSALRPFTPEQLEDLDRYQAVAKLQVRGETLPAFDFRTHGISAPADEFALSRIRESSRQRYARPRSDVESGLRQGDATPTETWNGDYVDEE